MAIPLAQRRDALERATCHVQVALCDIPTSFDKPFGELFVNGKVVQIFKSDANLRIGDMVQFSVPVVNRSEEEFPFGGQMFWFDELQNARYLEVCLNGETQQYQTALDLHALISEPSNSPVIHFEDFPTRNKRPWWRFGF